MVRDLEESEKVSRRDCSLAYINSDPITTKIGTVNQKGSFQPNYKFSSASQKFWNKRVTEKEVIPFSGKNSGWKLIKNVIFHERVSIFYLDLRPKKFSKNFLMKK